jgi:multiple RNA-binding domain-containing protein 1
VGRNEEDPKLKEYLGVMRAPSKVKPWMADPTSDANAVPLGKPAVTTKRAADNLSDEEEYQAVRSRSKRKKEDQTPPKPYVREGNLLSADEEDGSKVGAIRAKRSNGLQAEQEHEAAISEIQVSNPEAQNLALLADADWLRSKTSRTLDLVDDDEKATGEDLNVNQAGPKFPDRDSTELFEINTEPDDAESEPELVSQKTSDEDSIRESKRLFLRNLPYTVTEDDLRDHFSAFGNVTEVSIPFLSL